MEESVHLRTHAHKGRHLWGIVENRVYCVSGKTTRLILCEVCLLRGVANYLVHLFFAVLLRILTYLRKCDNEKTFTLLLSNQIDLNALP